MKKKKRIIAFLLMGLIVIIVCFVKWNYIIKPTEKKIDFSVSEIKYEYSYHYEISSIEDWQKFVDSVNGGKIFS